MLDMTAISDTALQSEMRSFQQNMYNSLLPVKITVS